MNYTGTEAEQIAQEFNLSPYVNKNSQKEYTYKKQISNTPEQDYKVYYQRRHLYWTKLNFTTVH